MEAALARTRQGVGSVILLAGEAGIGKTRLVSEIAERAERQGMSVAVGECLPLGEGELPYAPVVSALRSLESRLDDVELAALVVPEGDGLAELLGDARAPANVWWT